MADHIKSEKRYGKGWLNQWWQKVIQHLFYWHDRHELQRMDDRMLKDIGLSRADVKRMAGSRWQRTEPLTYEQYMKLDELQLMAFYKLRAEKHLHRTDAQPQRCACGRESSQTTEPGC